MLGQGQLDELDLVELVLSDQAPDILAIRPGFASDAKTLEFHGWRVMELRLPRVILARPPES